MEKICVLGLGYIGLPTAITLAEAGFQVHGVDIKPDVVQTLSEGRLPIVEPGLDELFASARNTGRLTFGTTLVPADAFIITVQTPKVDGAGGTPKADLTFVAAAARQIAQVLAEGNLVVLESTVPPTTCRMLRDELAQHSGLAAERFHVAHCPERVIPGRILYELQNNDRIIGGMTAEATRLACDIYRRVATGGQLKVTDDVTAEMCKLVENTFRDINIAFANELSGVCAKLGIDVFSLIDLANCHPRVNVHTPGVGVGGHCIAIDPWFIHERFPAETPLIGTARRINDNKPHVVAEAVVRELPAGAHVCVMGLAYKPDIDDLRESPSLTLCHDLRDRGVRVSACEPHVSDADIEGFANLTLPEALRCDYLVIALAHTVFREQRDKLAQKPHYDCVGLLR